MYTEQLIKDAQEILEDGINPDTGLPLSMEEYVAVEKEIERLKSLKKVKEKVDTH